MNIVNDNKDLIDRYSAVLKKFAKKKVAKDDKDYERQLLTLIQTRYKLYFDQIHNYLAPQKNDESEAEIQEHIKNIFVLDFPICEKKVEALKPLVRQYNSERKSLSKLQKMYSEVEYTPKGTMYCYFESEKNPGKIWKDLIPKKKFHFSFLSSKDGKVNINALAQKYDNYIQEISKILTEWLELYENFYALIAFRSLRHFALFMEWDKHDKEKVWKHSIDPFGDNGYSGVNFPFFYYFNQMVLNKNIKFLSKQYPTGYGKSYSNVIAISWLLGMNSENDCLVVLGNPTLVENNAKGIVDTMINKRFAKVFPEFAKYHNGGGEIKEKMFSVCQIKDGKLTLANSKKVLNVRIISKDTPIDGIRVRFLFLDDVCRSKDAENNTMHEKDIRQFEDSWYKRNYGTDDFYIIAGGTTYSIYDVLSYLISRYSKGKIKQSAINKYTTMSLDGTAVFISIPKLDYDTDKSTYPQKFPTKEAREMRERNLRSFMAMEQQRPMPPETTPFYWSNLRTYDTIPEEGRSPYCWGSIDPVRVGGDNCAFPIFNKIGDIHYLIDCVYEAKPMEELYTLLVDKIIQHKVTQLTIERNTDTSLKTLLDKMLKERNISFCNIKEVYTYRKKKERITDQQNTIKTKLAFPAQNLYSYASPMGRFMYDIVSYMWDQNEKKHDDSIDSVTQYCENNVNSSNDYNEIRTFDRRAY